MIDEVIGLIMVILSASLMGIYSFTRRKNKPRLLRRIPAFQNLRRAVGLAVEDGKRLHISLGNAGILDPSNTSALAGLSTLESVAQFSMVSDRPPIATSGDGTLAILSQDTLRYVYRSGNALGQYDPQRGRLNGVTPFAYVAGTIPVIRREGVAANILIGNYGPEVALLADSANKENAFTLAASDSLPAQAVLFATAQEPLIGEELYAIPTYLKQGPFHQASLHTQDFLRWFLIAILVGGAIIKLILSILGIQIL
jgi:hypothetical protein